MATVEDMIALIERISKLPIVSIEQKERLVTAALLEFDGVSGANIPRLARPSRYGKPVEEILRVLGEFTEPLTAHQIAAVGDVDRNRVNSALTKLYNTQQVKRYALEPSEERGAPAVGRSTVWGYTLFRADATEDALQELEAPV